jgi:hypothetical protein
MILPSRHLAVEASLLGIGAIVLAELDRPRAVSDLWTALRDEAGVVTFDRFCLAVTFLYTLGLVTTAGDELARTAR